MPHSPPVNGPRLIDSIRTADPRIDMVVCGFIAQRLGWGHGDPVHDIVPLVLESMSAGSYVIGAKRLLADIDAHELRTLTSRNDEDVMYTVRTRLDTRIAHLTYERDWYRKEWENLHGQTGNTDNTGEQPST